MKQIVIIDGQGGKIGAQLIDMLRGRVSGRAEILAIGTNSIATSAMLRCSPDAAATGENPVIAACRHADVIAGPIGIVIADALFGEVTPGMAEAVGQSRAHRVLIPVNKCSTTIVGVGDTALSELLREAAETICRMIGGEE
ncbi:MAG: DUF3842 family protein [Ruminococcaceae bacterium]|nr:DUF3842 family protein [Oscillospiraceae bacterium]